MGYLLLYNVDAASKLQWNWSIVFYVNGTMSPPYKFEWQPVTMLEDPSWHPVTVVSLLTSYYVNSDRQQVFYITRSSLARQYFARSKHIKTWSHLPGFYHGHGTDFVVVVVNTAAPYQRTFCSAVMFQLQNQEDLLKNLSQQLSVMAWLGSETGENTPGIVLSI